MKITRSLIGAASAVAIMAGSTPAFAYVSATPPVATTTLRQRAEIRELYADAFSSILELANMHRGVSTMDTTGRSFLARAQVRAAQRNYRRHVLGYLRGVDYRVLNISGASRTLAGVDASLPTSLVRTGGGASYSANAGSWGTSLKPTRRQIREGSYYGQVNDRKRDILGEMENSSR